MAFSMKMAHGGISYPDFFIQVSNHRCNNQTISLKWTCCHFDDIFLAGCIGSCHSDNFQCSQWEKCHENDDISALVLTFDQDVPVDKLLSSTLAQWSPICFPLKWRTILTGLHISWAINGKHLQAITASSITYYSLFIIGAAPSIMVNNIVKWLY